MHDDLLETLEAEGAGVGACERFARACFTRAAEDSGRAAFLFALGTIAQRFAAHYLERPLHAGEAEALQAKLRGHMERMQALSPDDSAGHLAMLNALVVAELESAE